ncbi:uncharacterized protein LOC108743248 [Agrilus planipennis]|uniref:Uncharacterized protein LOC108743248 n=1 Tax=Agrilus planipennis TaxID=224129 RepID=A0A1W4XPB5_AGRPL|nr:uncharacterized protein LOC108743248 [Agrilus planipennis]
MLPKPLMYRERKDYWIKLSDMCKTWLETKSFSAYTSKELVQQISQTMMTLPEYNQIMSFYLFDFLRQLSLLSETYPVAKRFNKGTALTLSRYFARYLFQKMSNFDHRTEKRYYFVVIFIITKWSEISTEFVTHNSTCHMFLQTKTSSIKTKVLFFERRKPRNETNDFTIVNLDRKPLTFNKIRTRNSISSQTDVCLCDFDSEFSELASLKNFQNDYLKDFGCQTEPYNDKSLRIRGCCWCCENGRKFNDENELQAGLIDDFSQTDVDDFVNEGHETRSFCDGSKFYTALSGSFFPGWRLPQIDTGIKKTETIFENLQPYSSSLTSFHSQSNENSSIADDSIMSSIPALIDENLTNNYPGFCENVQTQSSPKRLYPDLQTFNPLTKEEPSKNEILDKIQSIGWTYSPQFKNNEKVCDTLSVNQNKSKDFLRYRLNFDKFSKEEPIEEIIEEEENFYPPRTYSDDAVVSKSKKKVLKLGKVKLNLSIVNFFKLKKSVSFHQVGSNVKYKKM